MRGEVMAAVAYPVLVLGFGFMTVTVLLTVVLPRLFQHAGGNDARVLPLPTLILLKVSHSCTNTGCGCLRWIARCRARPALVSCVRRRARRCGTGSNCALPIIGPVFRSAALGRFARTLGTLVKSGVSLLPALKIVEHTIGNRVLAAQIALVAEETRGGDSLAAPLRKLGIFPRTVVQMIDVGEESGKLDEMLLKVADIEERHMRTRIKTLISLLAPFSSSIVGAMVGFMVIALCCRFSK